MNMFRPGDTLSVKGEEKTKAKQRVKKIDILDIGMSCFFIDFVIQPHWCFYDWKFDWQFILLICEWVASD